MTNTYEDAVTDGAAEFNEHIMRTCFCNHASGRCGAPLDANSFDGQCGVCAWDWVDGACRYAAQSPQGLDLSGTCDDVDPIPTAPKASNHDMRGAVRAILAGALLFALVVIPSALVIASLATPSAQYAGVVLAVVATGAGALFLTKALVKP